MNGTEKELPKFENLEEQELNSQLQAANKLLLEMVKNQKANARSIIKVFIVTIVCYTVILLAIIICLFAYEGQYETIDSNYDYSVEQNAESDDGGNAIVNNGGDVHYGESESGS